MVCFTKMFKLMDYDEEDKALNFITVCSIQFFYYRKFKILMSLSMLFLSSCTGFFILFKWQLFLNRLYGNGLWFLGNFSIPNYWINFKSELSLLAIKLLNLVSYVICSHFLGNRFASCLRKHNCASRIWSRKLAAKLRWDSKSGSSMHDSRRRIWSFWDPKHRLRDLRLWRPRKRTHIQLVQTQNHVHRHRLDLRGNKNQQKRKKERERRKIPIGFFWQ